MVLDELQQEAVQKKQLLEKATSLLNCLENGQPYEWATEKVSLCVLTYDWKMFSDRNFFAFGKRYLL